MKDPETTPLDKAAPLDVEGAEEEAELAALAAELPNDDAADAALDAPLASEDAAELAEAAELESPDAEAGAVEVDDAPALVAVPVPALVAVVATVDETPTSCSAIVND